MNYYFMIHDIAPVIIYNEDKPAYYRALEAFDQLFTILASIDIDLFLSVLKIAFTGV